MRGSKLRSQIFRTGSTTSPLIDTFEWQRASSSHQPLKAVTQSRPIQLPFPNHTPQQIHSRNILIVNFLPNPTNPRVPNLQLPPTPPSPGNTTRLAPHQPSPAFPSPRGAARCLFPRLRLPRPRRCARSRCTRRPPPARHFGALRSRSRSARARGRRRAPRRAARLAAAARARGAACISSGPRRTAASSRRRR